MDLMPDELSLSDLLRRCGEPGRGEWIEALVKRLQPLVAGVVSRTLRRYGVLQAELVKDLSQDAFLKLLGPKFNLKERARGRSESEIVGLISVTVVNLVLDEVRKSRPCISIETYHEVPQESNADVQVLVNEVDAILKRLLVPPTVERDYRIFWLYHRNRMTAREISLLPGIHLTVKGVESVICRLTADLKQALIGSKGISSKGAF